MSAATQNATQNAAQSAAQSAAQTETHPEPGSASPAAPMRLFHLSIAYLTLLFAAVAVTALLPWGRW